MTYPLLFKINKVLMAKISEVPGGDANLFLWYMWIFKQAIINLKNPFYTDMIFYPNGASLLWSSVSTLNMLISFPLQFIFSTVTIYNLLYLLTFILAGWGAYLLLLHLTKDKLASFIGGCIFAFTPSHFVHDNQLCYASIQWIPFFMLYFIKLFEKPRVKYAVLSAIFLVFTALSSLYYMVFTLFFILLFLVYKLVKNKKSILNRNYIKCFVLFSLLFSLLLSPLLVPMMLEEINNRTNVSSIDTPVVHSADLAAFFVPSPLHPLFKNAVEPFYERIWTYDGRKFGVRAISTVFLGYFVIFLLIYNIKAVQFNDKKFWWFICLCFFILTLGPALKIAGLITIPASGLNLDKLALKLEPNLSPIALNMLKEKAGIPLPFLIWHFVPLINFIRVPTHFFMFGIMAASIICSYSLASLFKKWELKRLGMLPKKYVMAAIFLGIILFEYLAVPLDYTQFKIPEFYNNIAEDQEDYVIVELPLPNNWSQIHGYVKLYMYYQTIHGKRLLAGHLAHYQKDLFDFIRQSPFLDALPQATTLIMEDRKTAYNLTNIELPKEFLVENKLKYFILQKKHFRSEADYKMTKEYFFSRVGKAYYTDDDIEVYKIY